MIPRLVTAAWIALAGSEVSAETTCSDITFDGLPFTICEADVSTSSISVVQSGTDGRPLGSFAAAEQMAGAPMAMAMNGGMYHDDRSPVGLMIEDGVARARLVTSAGPGNFGLLPNGVFCVRDNRADVIETLDFAASPPDCRSATQSGPMLVIDGALHPRFLPDSTSRFIRNGVGTSADGQRVIFAISNRPVTFHEFGRLFRDGLNFPQALYLDGNVSRMFAPGTRRRDQASGLGPMIIVTDGPPGSP